MSKTTSEEIKEFEEFRKHELSVGEILDSSSCVMADMLSDEVLNPIDLLKIPMVIIAILKKAIEEKENENGTEKD